LLTGFIDTGNKFIASAVVTGVVDTGEKFIIGVVVTGNHFSAVSTTPVINLSPVSTTPPKKKIRDKGIGSKDLDLNS
jgi:hypothetical protein